MNTLLNDTIIKTFEQIAFWEPELTKSFDFGEISDDAKVCKISCLSPETIHFYFITNHETAQQLSDDINQNLFGSGEESIDDCIKEVMNVLGGDFCIHQFPEDEFELTIPEILTSFSPNIENIVKYECDEGDFFFQFDKE